MAVSQSNIFADYITDCHEPTHGPKMFWSKNKVVTTKQKARKKLNQIFSHLNLQQLSINHKIAIANEVDTCFLGRSWSNFFPQSNMVKTLTTWIESVETYRAWVWSEEASNANLDPDRLRLCMVINYIVLFFAQPTCSEQIVFHSLLLKATGKTEKRNEQFFLLLYFKCSGHG